jgi:hypothetical protein
MEEGVAIFYLNSEKPYELFRQASSDLYYVDKSMLLAGITERSICIDRPRGYGKTINAWMVACYFSNAIDSSGIFRDLKISKSPHPAKYQNQRSVIFMPLGEKPAKCKTYEAYISNIRGNLLSDLHEAYPNVASAKEDPVELLKAIHKATGDKFMFVLDDWDFIFRSAYSSKPELASYDDKMDYLKFLHALLDGDHVLASYMTGVLPLPPTHVLKFTEYDVAARKFSQFFGFNGVETQSLIKRYNSQFKKGEKKNVSYESLRLWYLCGKLCNPYSTIRALKANKLDFFWFDAAPKKEMLNIIKKSYPKFGPKLAFLVSRVLVEEDEGFYFDLPLDEEDLAYNTLSVLATLGYIHVFEDTQPDDFDSESSDYDFDINKTYYFCAPNHEINYKLEEIVKTDKKYGYIYELANAFPELRDAILSSNSFGVTSLFEESFHSKTKIFLTSLRADREVMTYLAFLGASDYAIITRDDKVQYALVPEDPEKDAIIFGASKLIVVNKINLIL